MHCWVAVAVHQLFCSCSFVTLPSLGFWSVLFCQCQGRDRRETKWKRNPEQNIMGVSWNFPSCREASKLLHKRAVPTPSCRFNNTQRETEEDEKEEGYELCSSFAGDHCSCQDRRRQHTYFAVGSLPKSKVKSQARLVTWAENMRRIWMKTERIKNQVHFYFYAFFCFDSYSVAAAAGITSAGMRGCVCDSPTS